MAKGQQAINSLNALYKCKRTLRDFRAIFGDLENIIISQTQILERQKREQKAS